MNLTGKQWITIAAALLSYIAVATVQLTDIFGATTAKSIASVAGFISGALNTVLAVITGQASLVTDVQAMPGVERIVVNENANKTLANLATDPTQDKIEVKPGAEAAVNATTHT